MLSKPADPAAAAYWELTVTLAADAVETAEAVTNRLWELGAVGVVRGDRDQARRRSARSSRRGTDARGAGARFSRAYLGRARGPRPARRRRLRVDVAALPDEPWADAWRAHFRPVPVGRRLLVCPPWETSPAARRRPPRGRLIEPGRAFGTGGHGSTRSCPRAPRARVARARRAARAVDVGCGSGILAIAAAGLGVARVDAIDVDPDAVAATDGQRPAERRRRTGCSASVAAAERVGWPRGAARPRESPGCRARHPGAQRSRELVGRRAVGLIAGGLLSHEVPIVAGDLRGGGVLARRGVPRTTGGRRSSCAEGRERDGARRSPGERSHVPRVFVRPDAVDANRVRFDAAEAHHLRRVLRLRPGAVVEATDGAGGLYTVRLVALDAEGGWGAIEARDEPGAESPCAITLAQAILEGGSHELARPEGDGARRRADRVHGDRPRGGPSGQPERRSPRRAGSASRAEAVKQCGRVVVPAIDAAAGLRGGDRGEIARIRRRVGAAGKAGGQPLAPRRARRAHSTRLLLLIGPEGGFTAEEVGHGRGAQAPGSVSLGPRILRAESAGTRRRSRSASSCSGIWGGARRGPAPNEAARDGRRVRVLRRRGRRRPDGLGRGSCRSASGSARWASST